jgi:hypothetical protein
MSMEAVIKIEQGLFYQDACMLFIPARTANQKSKAIDDFRKMMDESRNRLPFGVSVDCLNRFGDNLLYFVKHNRKTETSPGSRNELVTHLDELLLHAVHNWAQLIQ